MTAMTGTMMPPPPMPWRARVPMSWPMFCDRPASIEALAALVAWIAYLCCPWIGLALVGETLVLAALVAFVRAWCHRRLVALEGVL